MGSAVRAQLAMLGGAQAQLDEHELPIPLLEDAPCAVGKVAGLREKPSIAQAKTWLRQQNDGTRLAAGPGRLSKLRNGHAHPDRELCEDILRMLVDSPVGKGACDSSGGQASPCTPAASPGRGACDAAVPPAVAAMHEALAVPPEPLREELTDLLNLEMTKQRVVESMEQFHQELQNQNSDMELVASFKESK